jgi:PAS domain S-box-containing protein
MATSTTTLDLLVVADEPGDRDAVARRLGFAGEVASVSLARAEGDLRDRIAGVDCVLCTSNVDPDRCLDLLSTLCGTDPGVPVIVFAGDRGSEFVTAALDAGAADVIQSTLAAAPPALVRRRVESAIDAERRQAVRRAERRERELQAERDLVERILDTSPVGIAVIGADGTVVRANDRTAEILGVDRDEFVGKPVTEIDWRVHDEAGEPVYCSEIRVERPADGSEAWIATSGAPLFDESGEVSQVVMTFEDVTERRERERKMARQRDELEQLDRLNAVVRDVDQALVGATTREGIERAVCERLAEAGRYRFAVALRARGDRLVPTAWTDVGEAYVDAVFPVEDVTPEDSPGLQALETGETQVVGSVRTDIESAAWHERALEAGVESAAAVPVIFGVRSYGVIAVYAGEPDAFGDRELAVLDELGETVGHAIDALERREREETLTALYEATRDLLGTETERAVCDVVVDVATETLDLPEVGIFLFDDEENVLRPASATEDLVAFYGEADTFGPGLEDSETWHAYVTGETKVFDDVSESERVANPDTEARSSFVRPLGEHGVFVAASAEAGIFDGYRRKLLGLLAATAETALDRVAGQAGIREREQELADQTRRLERLSRVADLLRDVAGTLVRATAREEIEEAVCERLAEENGVAFAWIGTVPPDGDALVPRAWAGDGGGYLDDVSLAVDGAEPAARTAASGSTTAVSVTDHLHDHAWARTASDRGYQSAVAVPLVYGETTYGVAAVCARDPDALEGTEEVLAELGELVGYAINGAETKQGVLADRVTELELRIPEPGTFVNAVAALAGEPVRYLEITPAADGRAHLLFGLDEVPVPEVLALESEFVGVESLRHVGNGERHLFRATVTGRTIAATLLSCGGLPDEVVAHPEETVAVVRLPSQLDVRVFLDRVRETYPSAELIARHDRSGRKGRDDLHEAANTELTERQREVLRTAYESGFFESPRETTGAELADLLDVSQPTVTHHLREGQRRLFAVLFGDGS